MDGLTISIGWEYFLGISAGLIAVAWFCGRRFSNIETDVTWLKDSIKDIKLSIENLGRTPFLQTHSPIDLTEAGAGFLKKSGLDVYINDHEKELLKTCKDSGLKSAYDIQQLIFDYFDVVPFDKEFEKTLKDIAYQEGVSMELARRIGAVYFRNRCFEHMKLNKSDVDKLESG
jgi:hypothetical protein